MKSSRQIFIDACNRNNSERAPFWIMRQAGRYLPEYRDLKSKYGFLKIVKTPELATEATLQPIRRFDFDCAIVFSDILVIAEALGFPYDFKDGGGIVLKRRINSIKDIEDIEVEEDSICKNLSYVADALKILRKELPQKALLGFCGAPFTLGAYMIEGQSSTEFKKFSDFFKTEPIAFALLMQKLSTALKIYAKMQSDCGIDGFQIFDSHASLTPKGTYEILSGQYIDNIANSLPHSTSSILYAKGMNGRFAELLTANTKVYSLDSSQSLSKTFKEFGGNFALQGNVEQSLLESADKEIVKKTVADTIQDMKGSNSHILNLGHGITPNAKIENVEAFCQVAKENF